MSRNIDKLARAVSPNRRKSGSTKKIVSTIVNVFNECSNEAFLATFAPLGAVSTVDRKAYFKQRLISMPPEIKDLILEFKNEVLFEYNRPDIKEGFDILLDDQADRILLGENVNG